MFQAVSHLRFVPAVALALLSSICAAQPAQQPPYPSRPVTVITGFGAGGGPDVVLRVVAERLSRLWSQQVVILNRPGANNTIAMQAAAQAAPDGYTLLLAPSGLFYAVPETQPTVTVSAARDFVPIGLVGDQPMLVAVNSKLPVTTLAELVAFAKGRAEPLVYGAGRGSLPHITAVRLQRATGINVSFVPYPATAGAINDSISGTLPFIVESMSALSSAIESGTLRPLAVAAAERLPSQPKLPTVKEALPDLGLFEALGWFALVAPVGTPEPVVEKVAAGLGEALKDEMLLKRYEALGTRARILSPDQIRALIDRDQELLRPLVRSLSLQQ